jgi:hypothetical protein
MRTGYFALGLLIGVPIIMLYAGLISLVGDLYPTALKNWLETTKFAVDFLATLVPAIDNAAGALSKGPARAPRLEEFRNVIAFNWWVSIGFAVISLGSWHDGIQFHKKIFSDKARQRKALFASLGLLLLMSPVVYFGIGFRSITFRAAYNWPFPVYFLSLSIGSFLLVFAIFTLIWMMAARLQLRRELNRADN